MFHFASSRRFGKSLRLSSLFQLTPSHWALLIRRLLVSLLIGAMLQPSLGLARTLISESASRKHVESNGFAPGLTPVQQLQPGQSFTYLQPGFTQEIVGVSPHFGHIPHQQSDIILSGVAFAPNGDPMVADCGSSGEILRFDLQGATSIVHGTAVHNQTALPTGAICGLTNHPNGLIYGNTNTNGHGVAELDPNTGAVLRAFGPAGNSLGIVADPQTNHLIYLNASCDDSGSSCALIDVDPVSGNSHNFATFSTAEMTFGDGLTFDPSGNFLFVANRANSNGTVWRMTIINRQGQIVQDVPMNSEPEGVAFHATGQQFVLTNNADGTMTRFDFPNNDFTKQPIISMFASGGFYGDLMQVGPDGSLYLSQAGTRFNDGTVVAQPSLVRIGSDFAAQPTVTPANISLNPNVETNAAGIITCAIATVTGQSGQAASNNQVNFNVTGANTATGSSSTDVNGQAQFCYVGAQQGGDSIAATAGGISAMATRAWTASMVTNIVAAPRAASSPAGQQYCVGATVRDQNGVLLEGIGVGFVVSGANTATGTIPTDANGQANFCYIGANSGSDSVLASSGSFSDTVNKTWTATPPPANVSLSPKTDSNRPGTISCLVAMVTDANNAAVAGTRMDFSVSGANTTSGTQNSDANGQSQFCYVGMQSGTDNIVASVGSLSDSATKTWTTPPSPGSVVLSPKTVTGQIGLPHCVVATVKDQNQNPLDSTLVNFTVTGANPTISSGLTDVSGGVPFCYAGPNAGLDTISASAGSVSDTAGKTWTALPSATNVALTPKTASHPVNNQRCVAATVTDANQHPVEAAQVSFIVAGANPGSGSAQTDQLGQTTFCYLGANAGSDSLTATVNGVSDTATKTWVTPPPPAPAPSNKLVVVRHAPSINGHVDGSIQQLLGESINLNSGAVITNDLMVPGTPTVQINGTPSYQGTTNGTGSTQPTGYSVTINSGVTLGHVVRRTDPITLANVPLPPTPSGTRDVNISSAGQSAGNYATLRNLTMNSGTGQINVPPGTYGQFTANSQSGFTFGVAGSSQPTIYNFQGLTLNSNSRLIVVGPVVLNIANSVMVDAGVIAGDQTNTSQLSINIAQFGLTINSTGQLYGNVNSPSSTVMVNGTLNGAVSCDRLTLNGGSVLKAAGGAGTNVAPSANAGSQQTITFPANSVTLIGTATDDGLPAGASLTYSWSKISGPGTVTFGNAGAATTSATFSVAGRYDLRLTASDSQLTGSDDVIITVSAQNQAPAVTAGLAQMVSMPGSALLAGTVADDGLPLGNALSVAWSKVSGPGTVTFANPNLPETTASFSSTGVYVLRLTASDGSLASTADVTVTVTAANQTPVVNAGASQTITLPNVATLTGTASDDGLPTGSALAISWGKISGPGTVAFANPAQASTTATFSGPGTYVLRLTASDSELSASSDVTITVNAANQAPVVYISPGQTASLGRSASLSAIVTDDGLPAGGTLLLTWSKLSGPGSVSFSNPAQSATTASFNTAGTYVLRLTASDSQLSGTGEVTITVRPANQGPMVSAGANQTVSLPNSATLTGTVTDDGNPVGSTLTVAWGKISGPGVVTFASPNQTSTIASFSAAGTYILRLTASDSQLAGSADITIAVNPINQAPYVAAGPDQFATVGVPLALNGFAIDDGQPTGNVLAITWSKVAGPGIASFSNANLAVTSVTFDTPGVYTLRLSASDSQLSGSDDVIITVDPPNQPPVVNAGPNQTITLPANSVSLNGTVTDDGFPRGGNLTTIWSKISGPGTANFSNANSPVTSVSFDAVGTYLLRLTASDSQLSSSSDVTITVNAPVLSLDSGGTVTAIVGATQTLKATAKDPGGLGIPGVLIQFNVSGANPISGNTLTNINGVATFSYVGHSKGTDSIQAVVTAGATQFQSNLQTILWITPVQSISTSSVHGLFFTADGSGIFNTPADQTPVFGQDFPTINFNPPDGTIPGNTSGVNVGSRPFTDITTDLNGNFTGTIIAQGNGFQAGVGPMFNFNLALTGSFTVAAAGDVTFTVYDDDGFFMGVGNGATRVGGVAINLPASGFTPFANLPIMGGKNLGGSAVGVNVTVHFPAPGVYPYEVDYSEGGGGGLVLTMATQASGNHGLPPSGLLTLSPNTVAPQSIGRQQTFTVSTLNADAAPMTNLPLTLAITGANPQQVQATTGATGQATISYTGANAGTDTVQIVTTINGIRSFSNIVFVTWLPNQAPIVSAGSNQTIQFPGSSAVLSGSVTDDGLPAGAPVTSIWSLFNGPGTVSFGNPTQLSTTATFSVPGVYDLKLTASDTLLSSSSDVIVKVATGCATPPSGMVGWWKGEGDARDSLNQNNGSTVNGVTFTPGVDGQAFKFNGTNFVQIPDSASLKPANVTVDTWVRFDSLDTPGASATGLQYVVFKRNTRLGNFEGYTLYKYRETTQDQLYFVVTSAAGQPAIARSATVVKTGQFYHVTGTYDGTTAKIYVNGVLEGSAFGGFPIDYGNRPVFFGSSGETVFDGKLAGSVDEVHIFSRALSSSEISSIDLADLNGICSPPPVVNAGQNQSITLPSVANLNGSATDPLNPGAQLSYLWTLVSGPAAVNFGNATAPATAASFTQSGSYVLRLTATNGQRSGSSDVIINVNTGCITAPSGLVGWWRGEGNANDFLNLNNGTLVNNPGFAPAMDGQGFLFNGTNLVSIPDSPGLRPSAITIDGWVRFDAMDTPGASDTGLQYLFFKRGNGPSEAYSLLKVRRNGLDNFVFVIGSDPTLNTGAFITSTTTVTLGQFYHIAATYDGANLKLYVNGVLEASQPNTFALGHLIGSPLILGSSGESFDGKLTGVLDEAHLFNRALSAGEIQSIFQSNGSGLCTNTTNQAPVVSAGPAQAISIQANLLQNGGNESPLVTGQIPGWTVVSGNGWTQATAGGNGFPTAIEGNTYFYAGATGASELRQDVNVSAYTSTINSGTQQFTFSGYVRSLNESPADSTRVIIEYRDASNTTALRTLDTGPITSVNDWSTVSNTVLAPTGTAWIRVRLIATRNSGANNDAYFDALALRPVATAGVNLNGITSDDGFPLGSTLTSTWSTISGPGPVNFSSTNTAVSSATFTVPGAYVLRLSANDGQLSSSSDVTITVSPINQSPMVSAGPSQTVSLPHVAVLNGSVTDDGQPAGRSLSIQWSVISGPGSVIFANPNQAATTATFSVPGHYVLQLYASDSDLFSSSTVNITVTPPNQPPVVSAGANQTINLPTNSATLIGTASDDGLPVGSTLTFAWSQVSGPGTVMFGTPNALTATASFNNTAGTYVLRLTASDGELSSTSDVTVTVVAPNQPPVVNAGANQTITLPNNQVFLSGSATDDGLPTGSTLSFNWTLVSGPASVSFGNAHNAATTATFTVDGPYVLQLSASDGQLSSSATTTVTVNPATAAPTVSIDSPADGADVTKRTDIVGSISFPSAGGTWKLEHSLNTADGAPGQTWTTFATGSGSMTGAALGTFDPTVLLNGTYSIRLSATDAGGQISAITTSVIVSRNQKVGNFTVSFNDLSVPLPGLPIQVVRTYDSRDKKQGDFGVGWTLSLSNIRIEKTGTLGDHWEEDSTGGLLPTYTLQSTKPRIVTIIFPNGRVYKFQVAPSPSSQRLGPITGGTIGFTELPGATGTAGAKLEVVGGTNFLVAGSVPGLVQLVDEATQNLFNPTLFKLTVAEGYSYVIDQGLGVQSLTDPNGNTLTINANGITHSNGESVAFTRDALGRITQITDLAGHAIVYNYDVNGDLVSVTDRENNTTTFTYDNNHYLLTIVDPRGIQPLRNEFDANGRLINQTDAFGKTIGYQHDLPNNRETITDRLGQVTVHEYDDDGNVVKTTDAKGGVTTYTYDADDNQLSTTNALGNMTTYTYDSEGDNLTVTDPLNHTITSTYNSRRQLLTLTDARGGVATNAYDSSGNLLTSRDPMGSTITNTYNGLNGQLLSSSDPLSTTNYSYDSLGNLRQETDLLGNTITYEYNLNHKRVSKSVNRTTSSGMIETIITRYEYNNVQQLVKTVFANGSIIQNLYNSNGQLAAKTDQLGQQTSFTYDDGGKLITTTYPDGSRDSRTYDFEGRKLSDVDRAGRITNYRYDELGRQIKTTYPDSSVVNMSYDAIGEMISSVDADGNVTRYVYDASGHQTQTVNSLNQTTAFAYDPSGNQTSVTEANNHTTNFEYDADNRQVKIIYIDDTTQVTAYDSVGHVVSKIDQAGKRTSYEYDSLGRMTGVTDALGQFTSNSYDELGHLVLVQREMEFGTFDYSH